MPASQKYQNCSKSAVVIFSLALLSLDPTRFTASTVLMSSFIFLKTPGLSPNHSALTVRSRPRSSLCLVQHFSWARSQDLCVSGWSSQPKMISCRWTCSQCHCGRVTTLARESWRNCVNKMNCYKQLLFLQGTEEEIFSAIFGTRSAKILKEDMAQGLPIHLQRCQCWWTWCGWPWFTASG